MKTRILGIDPSLRGTGYGMIESDGRAHRVLDYGTIRNAQQVALPQCLLQIHTRISEIIVRWQPEGMAIENTIFVQSNRTAIVLGAARGAALLAAAQAGLPVFEYAPRRVKQAVVGGGAAGKHQVAFMVRALLGMDATPDPDAADALAVAQTHLQSALRIELRKR